MLVRLARPIDRRSSILNQQSCRYCWRCYWWLLIYCPSRCALNLWLTFVGRRLVGRTTFMSHLNQCRVRLSIFVGGWRGKANSRDVHSAAHDTIRVKKSFSIRIRLNYCEILVLIKPTERLNPRHNSHNRADLLLFSDKISTTHRAPKSLWTAFIRYWPQTDQCALQNMTNRVSWRSYGCHAIATHNNKR